MAKVKKRAAVTGVRNVKAGKRGTSAAGTSKQKGTTRKAPVRAARKATVKAGGTTMRKIAPKRAGRAGSKVAGKTARKVVVPMPVVRVAVRELDPQRKCGEGTSVQFLYRVDETVDGRATAHLVFFDRHGWYCEHGRTCPAVAHARKHNGHIARAS